MNNFRKKVIKGALVALLATAMSIGAGATASAATVSSLPWTLRVPSLLEDSSFPRAALTSLVTPNRDPNGANNWNCKPSAAHPEPVILIHGTLENAYNNWNGLSPILKAQGYCVFAVNYGNTGYRGMNGTADLVASAHEIAAFVNKVVKATKAKSVALIGHSQGGAQARYVANLLLPVGLVSKVIGIAPSNHWTTLGGLTTLADLVGITKVGLSALDTLGLPGPAQQSRPDAPFYVDVNGLDETIPGIDYTVIATQYDEVVTPYTQAFISPGPGAGVDNITIQNVCPTDLSEHMSLPYSRNAAQIILNKLDPQHQHRILCYVQMPVTGGTR